MALSDLNLGLLQQMVRKAKNGMILPFKWYTPEMGRLTFHDVLEKVRSNMKGTFKQQKNINFHLQVRPQVEKSTNKTIMEDLEFLVRRTLVYVARGVNRMEALRGPQSEASKPIPNIEYNYHYLPPGLREPETKVTDKK